MRVSGCARCSHTTRHDAARCEATLRTRVGWGVGTDDGTGVGVGVGWGVGVGVGWNVGTVAGVPGSTTYVDGLFRHVSHLKAPAPDAPAHVAPSET